MPQARELYRGGAIGGPLDGREVVSRFGMGLLAVDKAAGRCWLYDYLPGGDAFRCRETEGREVQTTGPDNRYRAAFEDAYDVVALP